MTPVCPQTRTPSSLHPCISAGRRLALHREHGDPGGSGASKELGAGTFACPPRFRGISPESHPLSHCCRLMSRPALVPAVGNVGGVLGPPKALPGGMVLLLYTAQLRPEAPSGLGLHLTGTQRRGRPWAPHTACLLLRSSGIPHLTKDGKDGLASTSLGLGGATTEVMGLILGSCEAESTGTLGLGSVPSWGEGTEHISQASSGNSVQLRPQKQRFRLSLQQSELPAKSPCPTPTTPTQAAPPAQHASSSCQLLPSSLALGRTHCSARVSSQAGP